MKNWTIVNESIQTREPYSSPDDGTYYNRDLFKHFCKNRDYKYVAIFGYYKSKYGWTDEQTQAMYDKSPDGWTDGLGVYRLFDWGKGENKLSIGEDWEWHEPQLDHIVPKSKGGLDIPENFQVLPAIINRILSNLTDDTAPAVLPIVLEQFAMVDNSVK